MKHRNVDEKIAVLAVAELVAASLPAVPVARLVRKKKPAAGAGRGGPAPPGDRPSPPRRHPYDRVVRTPCAVASRRCAVGTPWHDGGAQDRAPRAVPRYGGGAPRSRAAAGRRAAGLVSRAAGARTS
jgi:hypothetical protein